MTEPWNKKSDTPLIMNILSYLTFVFFMVFSIMNMFEIAIFSAMIYSLSSNAMIYRFSKLKTIDYVVCIFFTTLTALIVVVPFSINLIERYNGAILWFVLALMAGISLMMDNPFTIQYAKQSIAESVWSTSQFYEINRLLTWIFLVSFSLNTAISIIWFDNMMQIPVSFVVLGIALGFTRILPRLFLRQQNGEVTRKPVASDFDMSHLTMYQILEGMCQRFNPTLAAGWEIVIQFLITGANGGEFFFEILGDACTMNNGIADNPNLTLIANRDDWIAIAQGTLDGAQAFLASKLRIQGNLKDLIKMEKVFLENEISQSPINSIETD